MSEAQCYRRTFYQSVLIDLDLTAARLFGCCSVPPSLFLLQLLARCEVPFDFSLAPYVSSLPFLSSSLKDLLDGKKKGEALGKKRGFKSSSSFPDQNMKKKKKRNTRETLSKKEGKDQGDQVLREDEGADSSSSSGRRGRCDRVREKNLLPQLVLHPLLLRCVFPVLLQRKRKVKVRQKKKKKKDFHQMWPWHWIC